jgi:uncharacterized 2Fe-2S/4Fe-4S cluster protein (DUF4445 family)
LETVEIRIHPSGKVLRARKGSSLKDALHGFGVEFPCGGRGTCGKCAVRVLEGSFDPDSRHRKCLDELKLGPGWRLACMSSCQSDMVLEIGQYETLIQADETPFEFNPGEGLGVAVDLGTTTLVVQLVDLETGHILAVETDLNPQARYGSDLISRLEAALAGGSGELTGMIRARIGAMVQAVCFSKTSVLTKIVLVGNTVMQHFFCGSDIRPLSFYPFHSPDLGMKCFTSRELGWTVRCDSICFYPSIGSFVGSDILAGIEATGMHRQEFHSVLIDLGTNGEIVAGNREGLLCASTAAGPAFEGARISMGMLAKTGAIATVRSIKEGAGFSVIGDTEPLGICGSGLIDAVGVLLSEGFLGEFGEILSGSQEVMIATPVRLTQKDIHEFQLAKAAIAAGIEILLGGLGIQPQQVTRVFIAGAFGSYIDPGNVLRTGMLDFREEVIHKRGNTAMMGARMFLFTEPSEVQSILERTRHMNLESEPRFQDLYVDHMKFILP